MTREFLSAEECNAILKGEEAIDDLMENRLKLAIPAPVDGQGLTSLEGGAPTSIDPAKFSDHPDFIGGVKWSDLELAWIAERDKKWQTRITYLESMVKQEAAKAIEFGEKLTEALAGIEELRNENDGFSTRYLADYITIQEQQARIAELRDAAEGLALGVDWNNGTHAKIYRPKLLKILSRHDDTTALEAVKREAAAQALKEAAVEHDKYFAFGAGKLLRRMAEEKRKAQ